jgi:integrase
VENDTLRDLKQLDERLQRTAQLLNACVEIFDETYRQEYKNQETCSWPYAITDNVLDWPDYNKNFPESRYLSPSTAAMCGWAASRLSGVSSEVGQRLQIAAASAANKLASLNDDRLISKTFTDEDEVFLHAQVLRLLASIITLAVYAGPRRGELLKLLWTEVDFALNTINFKKTKTNKDRSVPLEPIVREVLSELHETGSGSEYVFVNPDTGTLYTEVKKSFASACREAGITDFRFHDLRHTFGTRLADAGVDVVKVKELMGHASIVTTMRYIHATDQGKRGAIVVLSEYRQQHCRKFVTSEAGQSLQPALTR